MNPMQALDLMHMNGKADDEDTIELAEDLIDNTLKYVAHNQDAKRSGAGLS